MRSSVNCVDCIIITCIAIVAGIGLYAALQVMPAGTIQYHSSSNTTDKTSITSIASKTSIAAKVSIPLKTVMIPITPVTLTLVRVPRPILHIPESNVYHLQDVSAPT